MSQTKSNSRSWSALPRMLGMILLSVWVGYLVCANVVLVWFLPTWATGESVSLSYASARTFWPGRVWLRDFRLTGHDYNIQFELLIDQATVDVNLFALPFRRFSASRADTAGVVFKLRHNVGRLQGNERRLEAFPQIAEYPRLAVYLGQEPTVPPESQDPRWSIAMNSVQAQIRELWLLEYHFVGQGHASGGFALNPSRAFELESSRLRVDGGVLSVGQATVARELALDLKAEVRAKDLQSLAGVSILRHVDAQLSARLSGGDLSFLDTYLVDSRMAGPSDVRAEVHLSSGVVQPGTKLVVDCPLTEVTTTVGRSSAITVRSAIRASLKATDSTRGMTASVEALEGAVNFDNGPTAARLAAGIHFPSADLAVPLSYNLSELGVKGFEAPELEWFERFFEPSAPRLGGSGSLDLSWYRGPHDVVSGEVALSIASAHVSKGTTSLRGTLSADSRIGLDDQQNTTFPQFSARVSRATLDVDGAKSDVFNGDFRSSSLRWIDGDKLTAVQGTFDLHLSPANALLPPLIGSAAGKVAQMLTKLSDLQARVSLLLADGRSRVDLLNASFGPVQAQGTWQQMSSGGVGAFLLKTDLSNVGITLKDGQSDVTLKAPATFLADTDIP